MGRDGRKIGADSVDSRDGAGLGPSGFEGLYGA